jgi:hypothetical protein
LGCEIGTNLKIECHYPRVTRTAVSIHFDWAAMCAERSQVQF